MKILLVSGDRLAAEMAGAGIRTWELARVLARRHDVCIAAPEGSAAPADEVPLVTFDVNGRHALAVLASRADVIISPPLPPRLFGDLRTRWIVDLYNPEPFEGLEHQKARPRREQRLLDVVRIDRISYAARRGDAFACASERQRDMWLGYLAATRRLDSALYEVDPELRTLIDVVPFGLDARPPGPSARPSLRGAVFAADARILLWQGGLWDWLDPATVVRAVARLREDDARWSLAFPGAGRPSHRAPMAMSERVRELVRDLDLDGAVWLREGWTPYADRHGPLLDADVGVSAHPPTLETRFAYRTRMLDYVWARLPIVCTAGDEWADRVEREGLGAVVPPQDPDAFAVAVREVVERGKDAYRGAFDRVAAANTWERVAEPLIRLIDHVAERPIRTTPPVARALSLRHTAASVADDLRRHRGR